MYKLRILKNAENLLLNTFSVRFESFFEDMLYFLRCKGVAQFRINLEFKKSTVKMC
ncbi:hypothetical protein M2254_002620 [Chryseobacterium sp. BIGb0186]|nr:hypothetical protein [Chryseobacterium sp. BIGb0186]